MSELNIDTGNILLIASILLFISIIIGKAGNKFGIPALLLFLGVGMVFGNDGFGIDYNDPYTTQFIGVIALSIILFSGGMDTKADEVKPIYKQGIILATAGVVCTALITGCFAYYITGLWDSISLSFLESLLLGAVMSSTDSASVFSILRSKKVSLKENLRPTLELESGSNDPMAYILTILLIGAVSSAEAALSWTFLFKFVLQMSIGSLAGYTFGKLAVWLINHIGIPNESLYPILVLTLALLIYSFTDLLQGNGYLAVYIGGLIVGNSRIFYKRSIMKFFDGFTWLFQIIMFITLGLLVSPTELIGIWPMGLLTGLFMIFISRPVSVFLCLSPFRKISRKAKIFISWVGLRGAVPIIFATYPMIGDIENARYIFNIVFFITILSLLLQGTTIYDVAQRLKLDKEYAPDPAFGVELADDIKSSMSEIEVVPSLLEHGNKLMDLSLPDDTLVVMIKRDDKYTIPKGHTKLKEKDKLLVISDNEKELKKTYENLGIDYTIRKN